MTARFVETAVQAMKLGAYDYNQQAVFPLDELRLFCAAWRRRSG